MYQDQIDEINWVVDSSDPLEMEPGLQEIQAVATGLEGFVVQQDYAPVIRKVVRENTVLWPLIKKEKALADVVKELYEPPSTAPQVGFVDRTTLNPPENPADLQNYDFADPGQQIKACGGVIKFPHYIRSLYEQQNRPWGDIVARKTQRLMVQTLKTLERGLFTGNATQNQLSFNGIESQMPPSNVYTIDIRQGRSVVQALKSIVRLAIGDEELLRNITHIFTSPLGLELIERETDGRLQYRNMEVIRPGFTVPEINTQAGQLPIVTSPYIRDIDLSTDVNDPRDEIAFYLINIADIVWKGVVPEGGTSSLEPQMFDVTRYIDDTTPYLLEKRMYLIYGTLYITNRGQSLYKLVVKTRPGMAGDIN